MLGLGLLAMPVRAAHVRAGSPVTADHGARLIIPMI